MCYHTNKLLSLAIKIYNLDGENDDDEDAMQSDSDDEKNTEDQPVVQRSKVPFFGCVNRIRAMKTKSTDAKIVAAWSDARREVYLHDISQKFDFFDIPGSESKSSQIHRVEGHKDEGYALAWSSLAEGNLVSGDCAGGIRLTTPTESCFTTSNTNFSGHSASVEDLQWSPTEATVFASCSVDGSIAIFDTRLGVKPGLSARVANCDVNVISWNALTPFLMASGHDDGEFCIWDLRAFSSQNRSSMPSNKSHNGKSSAAATAAAAAARFNWHRAAVTSIEWHTHEESMLAVAGADNQITIWDLSTENDESQDAAIGGDTAANIGAVPPQLLFVHQGQEDIKELHWHPQIPGCIISTALTGINVFKTINS